MKVSRYWRLSWRADPRALPLADRHYNRQHHGSNQFVPPGRCLVLLAPRANALWTTSWPFSEYVHHKWGGAWINSMFRNEGNRLASKMIREAVAITRWYWPETPKLGMVTFINEEYVRDPGEYTGPNAKREVGHCYLEAGFRRETWADGTPANTEGGLHVFRMRPEDMPVAIEPRAAQMALDFGVA